MTPHDEVGSWWRRCWRSRPGSRRARSVFAGDVAQALGQLARAAATSTRSAAVARPFRRDSDSGNAPKHASGLCRR